MYGSTPLEDIPNYNVIVRALTEWTGSDPVGQDQTSITDGIGGVTPTLSGVVNKPATDGTGTGLSILGNVRQKYIHGIDTRATALDATTPCGFGVVPNGITNISGGGDNVHDAILGTNPIRRYQVQLALGLMTQEKLIPTKFMASQLTIEITLAGANECIYAVGASTSSPPTYKVSNVNLIPEILEFDASYDESFLKGLQTGGVPIKFSTWNNYRFNTTGTTANLQIQERSRSVKAIFCMQRRDPPTISTDSGAFFFNTNTSVANGASTLQDYQYRIGGRYFPASPVQNSLSIASNVPNGGCESYVELAKAINVLGDTRLSTSVNSARWALNPASSTFASTTNDILQEFDYDMGLIGFKKTGAPIARSISTSTTATSGDLASACFAMAIDLETSNGLEISGLNAEEQSDISLIARWSASQGNSVATIFEVFTYVDSMIVLRENNVLELIQ